MNMLLVTSANPKQLNADMNSSIVGQNNLLAFYSEPDAILSDPMKDIQIRAETVSSLLKEIIACCPPRHWGINE